MSQEPRGQDGLADWVDSLHGSEEIITVPPETPFMSPSGETQVIVEAPRSPSTTPSALLHVDVHGQQHSPETRSAPPERMSHPDSWTTAEVINVIEDTLTLPAAEVTAVVEAAARIDLDGPLLVTFISEADVHHLLTKHVGLTDSLQRLKLISKVRARIKLATAAATTTIENEFKGERERGHRMMAGEKSIAAPTLPAPPTGEQLPTYKQWQSKMKGYKGWCQLEDKSFAKIIDMMMVGNLSLDRLQGIKGQMTSKQLRMDSVLGVQLFNTMPEGLEKQFAKKNNYEMDGETSGMQMIGFINDKINKQSDARFDSLMAELADRQPIGHLSDLQAEISEIRRLQETIAHQGVSIPSWQLVPIIKKAVKTLVQDKELTLAFGTPFTVAMKVHSKDGEAMLDVMETLDYEIRHDPMWKHLLTKKSVSAGATRKTPRWPKEPLYKTNREDLQCISEREYGTCKGGDGCKGIHGKGGWTNKVCTNACYIKFKICPGFSNASNGKIVLCKDKHPERPPIEKMGEVIKQAKADAEMGKLFVSAGCQELRADNILPEGTTRSRTQQSFYHNEVVGMLLESNEEAVDFDDANSDSDPEINSDTSITNKDDSEGIGSLLADSASDQDESFELSEDAELEDQLQEEDDLLDRLDPQFHHLLEKGYTMAAITEMQEQVEAMQESLQKLNKLTMASVPASQRVLFDGGTFAHMFGTGVESMLCNRRKVQAIPIATANGTAWVDEMADLCIGEHKLKDGWVNPHMDMTLASESVLAEHHWGFVTQGANKVCYPPTGEPFLAEKQGTLHFWPVTDDTLDPTPDISHSVPVDIAEAVQALTESTVTGGVSETSALKSGQTNFASDADEMLVAAAGEIHEAIVGGKLAETSTDSEDSRTRGSKSTALKSGQPTFASDADEGLLTAVGELQDTILGLNIDDTSMGCENNRIRDGDGPEYHAVMDREWGHQQLQHTPDPLMDWVMGCNAEYYEALEDTAAPVMTRQQEANVNETSNTEAQAELPVIKPVCKQGKQRSTGEIARAVAAHIEGGHTRTLPEWAGSCDACLKAKSKNKGAVQSSGTDPNEQLETANYDCLDTGVYDCNGDRYNLTGVLNKTKLGMASALSTKESSKVAKCIEKDIAYIEAKTDPGNKKGYRIEALATDPGSEFQGAVTELKANRKMVSRTGETDRHTDQSYVENRNGMLQLAGTAMLITATGDNVDVYTDMLGLQCIKWANECINHTSITAKQKEANITAHNEQYGGDETLQTAHGIPIHTFGELCYIQVLPRDRKGKTSPRAIRAIWNGANRGNVRSICAIPITRSGTGSDAVWKLHKPVHSAQVRVVKGNFPLRQKTSMDVPTPEGIEIIEPEEATEEEAAKSDRKRYEVEKLVEHLQGPQKNFEYKVRWKGFGPEDDTWEPEANLSSCQEAIAKYWKEIAESMDQSFTGGVTDEAKSQLNADWVRHTEATEMAIMMGMERETHTPPKEDFMSATLKSHQTNFASDSDNKPPPHTSHTEKHSVGEKLAQEVDSFATNRTPEQMTEWHEYHKAGKLQWTRDELERVEANRQLAQHRFDTEAAKQATMGTALKSRQNTFASDTDKSPTEGPNGLHEVSLGERVASTICESQRHHSVSKGAIRAQPC